MRDATSLTLYHARASSASYRVRIALELKQVEVRYHEIDLGAAQHLTPQYLALNPLGLVPALVIGEGKVLTQSLAIVQWLDEHYPHLRLLPQNATQLSPVLEFCSVIGCDIHPLQSRRLARWLEDAGAQTGLFPQVARRAVAEGLAAAEQLVAMNEGPFCMGGQVTAADAWALPQLRNARAYDVDIECFPRLLQAEAATKRLLPASAG